ncbi:Carboxypeptidase B-like 5 [Homarus americanus]|uniref:Carboxypeptidase B-like 5 n=1 Tax=Homarus americanus TaxID=6706 RepID=A0A8J5N917_HOMAM|nr:Carboxypeptidase B-like 5 [Homarus americanus]
MARAQVLRVAPEEAAQVHYLKALHLQDLYDFWTEPRVVGSPVDIMAPAFQLPVLKKTLTQVGLKFTTMISDVGGLVAQEKAARDAARASAPGTMDWTSYHEYDEIMGWMDTVAKDHPDVCTVENVGKSYQQHDMKLLKLGKGVNKPIIFLEGGLEGREWISPAVLTYIIDQLVTKKETYDDLLSNVNFYFMPIVNPDGYYYTYTTVGASDDPCSEEYAGSEPFSEVEMRNVRDEIIKYSDYIDAYLSFHSYSQLWSSPWCWTTDLPDDWTDLDDLAHSIVEAVTAVHGEVYETGSCALSGPASGGSADWAKAVVDAKYSYTIELRDKGEFGFLLPEDQIIPTGEETMAGVLVLANFIKDNYS